MMKESEGVEGYIRATGQDRKKSLSHACGSATIAPRSMGVLSIEPPQSPYFAPFQCKISCFGFRDPRKELDLKIGAVSIGGSPQLAIHTLTPDENSIAIRPSDIDRINWSVFSTMGLNREIQMSLYNPNDQHVSVFGLIGGMKVDSLDFCVDGTDESDEFYEYLPGDPIDNWERLSSKSYRDVIASEEIELEPWEQGTLSLNPVISPFFKPGTMRIYGVTDDGVKVPLILEDVIAAQSSLYGSLDRSMFNSRASRGSSVGDVMNMLSDMIRALESGTKITHPHITEIKSGILTSHLAAKSGASDASWWPIISTSGLKREAFAIVRNPWGFKIRTSISLSGESMPCLSESKRNEERDGE